MRKKDLPSDIAFGIARENMENPDVDSVIQSSLDYLRVRLNVKTLVWMSESDLRNCSEKSLEMLFESPTPSSGTIRYIDFVKKLRRNNALEHLMDLKMDHCLFTEDMTFIPMAANGERYFIVSTARISRTDYLRTKEFRAFLQYMKVAVEHSMDLEEIIRIGLTDELTGLGNYRALKSSLRNEFSIETPFSVLFIDIDRFKSVNDRNGHIVGSDILKQIAAVLRESLGDDGDAFRYGGDEFVVVIKDKDKRFVQSFAEEFRKRIEELTFLAEGRRIDLTVTVGVAHCPEHARNFSDIIDIADKAMYEGKKTRKNTVRVAQL